MEIDTKRPLLVFIVAIIATILWLIGISDNLRDLLENSVIVFGAIIASIMLNLIITNTIFREM